MQWRTFTSRGGSFRKGERHGCKQICCLAYVHGNRYASTEQKWALKLLDTIVMCEGHCTAIPVLLPIPTEITLFQPQEL